MTLPLEAAPSAGGAAFSEILIAAALVGAVMLAFGWVVLRERTGHPTLVGRLADKISTIDGLPRWVGLPMYLLLAALLCAAFGVWWDVPIHMQNGRDEGPLANPSHYFILFGILGFTHAGVLSMGLARDPLPRRTVRLTKTWRVPMGSLVILGAGQIALLGFPADDVWHRLFGQDVTEWGPTHVMMIGGAVTCILGIPLLLAEAHQVGAPGTRTTLGRWRSALALALCFIPVAFLMEFDLGVPQYPAATQFIIAGFVFTWITTAVRSWFGPGGALFAAVVYLGVHAYLWVTVSLLPDVLTARFLLFVPAAVIVELVALVLPPRRRAVAFALVSALAVGTVGLYAEWLWSKKFMPLPQPIDSGALPVMLAVGTVAALGGALLGLWHVARLRDVAGADATGEELPPVRPAPTASTFRWTGLAGIGIAVVLMAYFAPPGMTDDKISATVALGTDCAGSQESCSSDVVVRFSPADAVDDAVWLYGLSWQGRGPKADAVDPPVDPVAKKPGVVRVAMEPTGRPGEFRSADPLPMYGNWKTLVRVHLLPTTMAAIPLHAPDDPAITSDRGREILARDGDVVRLSAEKQFLQREIKDDVPGWLNALAYGLVIGSWLLLVLFFGWCYAGASKPADAKPEIRTGATTG
ncbi:hypothetical protein ABIE44_001353 [Marmoricola sp. OAE513]|uniref:hypothetical protein n=1 Tax=Marmoricola sp. OAE513 TaxID=2817894 RepID=UPI001AEAF7D4